MHRIRHPSTVAVLPSPTEAGDYGYYTPGDPETDTPPTTVTAPALNRIQEELCGIVEGAGLSLDAEDNGQAWTVLKHVQGIRSATGAATAEGSTPDTKALIATSLGSVSGAGSAQIACGLGSVTGAGSAQVACTIGQVGGANSLGAASQGATVSGANAAAVACDSVTASGDRALVAASEGLAEASGDRSAVIASTGGVASGPESAVIAGAGEASGTATAVIASDSECDAAVSRAAVIASQSSDAGDAGKANAAVLASASTQALGDRSAVVASSGGTATGTQAAVVASNGGQASGTQAAVVASASSAASGENAAVLASDGGIASGDEAAVIGSFSSDATAARSLVVASRYTENATAQSIAGGNDDSGTPSPSTANQTWRIESVTGDIYHSGSIGGFGADYAELFPNATLGPLPLGRLVALDGEGVRLADPGDDAIGITSARPAVLGDSAWAGWAGRWQRDVFGAYVLDDEGRRVQSPEYDPARPYAPRSERPDEWTAVGLLGKLPLAVDASVRPGDYVAPGGDGVGTKAAKPTRVRAMTSLAEFDEHAGYAVVRCLVR